MSNSKRRINDSAYRIAEEKYFGEFARDREGICLARKSKLKKCILAVMFVLVAASKAIAGYGDIPAYEQKPLCGEEKEVTDGA